MKELWGKLQKLPITITDICTDNWNGFKLVFPPEKHFIGKEFTKGIEGNNCLLRHRVRRAFRKSCNFSKKLINHIKAFEMTFFYINYGYV